MATPGQLLNAGRQNLAGANLQAGTLQGAHGGTQQLGAAAMRRLMQQANGPDGDQTPGIVPSMPGIGGGQDMPPPAAGVGGGGGIQRLDAPPMAVDSFTMPPPSGVSGGGSGMGSASLPQAANPYASPTQGGPPPLGLSDSPGSGSSFNLPGFKPVSGGGSGAGSANLPQATNDYASPTQGGPPPLGLSDSPPSASTRMLQLNNPPPVVDSYSMPGSAGGGPDPNLMRQALNNPPDPAASPFGQAPAMRPNIAVDALPPSPAGGGGGGGAAGAPGPRGVRSLGAGGTPWTPPGAGGGLPGFRPKRPQVGVQAAPPPIGTRMGRQNTKPLLGQF